MKIYYLHTKLIFSLIYFKYLLFIFIINYLLQIVIYYFIFFAFLVLAFLFNAC